MAIPREILNSMYLDDLNDAVYEISLKKRKYKDLNDLKLDNPGFSYKELEKTTRKQFKQSLEEYLKEQKIIESDKPSWSDVKVKDGVCYIPEGIETIPSNAFSELGEISEIVFPTTLKRIREEAFCGFKGMKQIEIPDTVTMIGSAAFAADFSSVKLPKGLHEIEIELFYGSYIEEIDIPEGVRIIRMYAFQCCDRLKKVVLPSTLQRIEWDAFYDCFNLREITGKKLDEIDIANGAFDECTALEEDHFTVINGKLYKSSGINMSEDVVIPEGVAYLSHSALFPRLDCYYRDKYGNFICNPCKTIKLPKSLRELNPYILLADHTQILYVSKETKFDEKKFKERYPKVEIQFYSQGG